MPKIKPYATLFRVGNAFFASLVCLCSFKIAGSGGAENQIAQVIFSCLSVFFIVAFANAHNDAADFEIDKINRPNRPIPSGKISIKNAFFAAYSALALALAFGFLAGVKIGFLLTVAGLFAYIYNKKLKGFPLAGNFAVAVLSTVPIIIPIIAFGGTLGDFAAKQSGMPISPLHTAIAVYAPQSSLLQLLFFAFMLTFCREIIKDIEDIEGDKKLNLKTLPIVLGVNHSRALVFICEAQIIFQIAMFSVYVLAATAPFLLISVFLAVKRKWHLSQTFLKFAMLAGLISFISC